MTSIAAEEQLSNIRAVFPHFFFLICLPIPFRMLEYTVVVDCTVSLHQWTTPIGPPVA
jgi:hypothetical protein